MGCLIHQALGQKGIMLSHGQRNKKKCAIALIHAHKHYKLANVRLLDPSKTRFAYILHPFKILLMNKDAI